MNPTGMITTGLLVSLSPAADPDEVCLGLSLHPSLMLGEIAGRWLPVACEAEGDAGCREVHDWIAAQPGVAFVDVVHVNFEDESAPSASAVA